MPVRIYDIAKKLGIESKDVLAKAKELGITAARVPSSSLDKITAEYLEGHFKPAAPETPSPTTPTPSEPIAVITEAPPAPFQFQPAPEPQPEIPHIEIRGEAPPVIEPQPPAEVPEPVETRGMPEPAAPAPPSSSSRRWASPA